MLNDLSFIGEFKAWGAMDLMEAYRRSVRRVERRLTNYVFEGQMLISTL
jgi:hypothetical protein